MSVKVMAPAALFAGLLVGFLASMVLSNGNYTESYTHCELCGRRHTTLEMDAVLGGYRHTLTPGGDLRMLLAESTPCEHRYMDPPHRVFGPDPETEEERFQQHEARWRTHNLAQLEDEWPEGMGNLTTALGKNPEVTTRLLARFLSSSDFLPLEALTMLAGEQAWERRFASVQAMLDAYACNRTRTSIRCTLPVGGQRVVVVYITATEYGGGFNWRGWTPE